MDEREIYGSRRAVCPLYGEGYYKRALNMLSAEGPRKKQTVAKAWSGAMKDLYAVHFEVPLTLPTC